MWKNFIHTWAILNAAMHIYTLISRCLPMFYASEIRSEVCLFWNKGQISHFFPQLGKEGFWSTQLSCLFQDKSLLVRLEGFFKKWALLSILAAKLFGVKLALFTLNSRLRWKTAVKGAQSLQDSHMPLVWIKVWVNC